MERYVPRPQEQSEFGIIARQLERALLPLVLIQYLAANRNDKHEFLDRGVDLVRSLAPTGEQPPTPPRETSTS